MQFHTTGTDPTAAALLVCRNARWNLLVLLAIFWAIPIVWWYLEAPLWVLLVTGAIPLLITWPMLGTWRKRGRRDNWVLAVARDGLWLNFRDCEYHEAAAGETIVFVPYREIAAVRRRVHRYTTPSDEGGTTHYRDTYLEILLSQPDGGEVGLALQEERQRKLPERCYLHGAVCVQTKRSNAPISIEGDDAIRIKFSGSNYGLRPRIKKITNLLERYVRIDEDTTQRSAKWDDLEDAELDNLIRRLAFGGQKFDAIRLLRNRRGMSLTEAKQSIDELVNLEAGALSPEVVRS